MGHVKIKEGIFHVGDGNTHNGLDCNGYLMIDGDDVVLFDPGSIIEFDQVVKNIEEVVSLDKIAYIVAHHQDPDVCSNIPQFESLGLNFKVVTSWRSMTLMQYYGIQSEYYLLEENAYRLTLNSGRELRFIQTPYLHFPGAFVTYDFLTKSLFSSDLFGAFSFNRTTYADDSYMDKMLVFHEHYMPSNSVLRLVMDVLLTYEIDLIMPQHGSIINQEVGKYIRALRTLECGSLLSPLKKALKDSGGYLSVFNDVLRRFYSLYDHDQVLELFKGMGCFILNENHQISDYEGNPEDIWHQIFQVIKEEKGMIWIVVIEPYVRTLSLTYDIELPEAMSSLLHSAQMENERLIKMNEELEQTVKAVNEKLIKCPITGLYNERFLETLLVEELDKEDWRDVGSIAVIGIDDFSKYKLTYGADEEESVLNNIAYILKEQFGDNSVFKMDSTDFALYIKALTGRDLVEKLEILRTNISKSHLFLGGITVSIGVAFPRELSLDSATFELTVENYIEQSLNRLRLAKLRGKNRLVYESNQEEAILKQSSVLIVDPDDTNLEVLKTFVKELGVEVYLAHDGIEALEKAEIYVPNVIITEINLPKMDGFVLKEQLRAKSKTKEIEVVYLSYLKDETSVRRASELEVMHYLKKPYLLSELIGIIKRRTKG
jgi:diguanylate cyclase (GGDEF)-like protein